MDALLSKDAVEFRQSPEMRWPCLQDLVNDFRPGNNGEILWPQFYFKHIAIGIRLLFKPGMESGKFDCKGILKNKEAMALHFSAIASKKKIKLSVAFAVACAIAGYRDGARSGDPESPIRSPR